MHCFLLQQMLAEVLRGLGASYRQCTSARATWISASISRQPSCRVFVILTRHWDPLFANQAQLVGWTIILNLTLLLRNLECGALNQVLAFLVAINTMHATGTSTSRQLRCQLFVMWRVWWILMHATTRWRCVGANNRWYPGYWTEWLQCSRVLRKLQCI